MWCEDQFAVFNSDLSLDDTRQNRIISAVARFIEFAKSEEQLKLALTTEPFFQGSVATRTAIRPLTSGEFDVDVVFPFTLSAFQPEHQNPGAIFEWFVTRLQTSEDYRKRMKKKNRCVRLDYAGDFHVDLIPATTGHPQHHPYAVPARDLSDWVTSDPIGFTEWVNAMDARSGLMNASGDGVFRRCLRYMKRWRDHNCGEAGFAPSVMLVTILGKHEASNPNYNPPLASPLYPTFKNDVAYLCDLLRLTVSCIAQPNHGAFIHPTIQEGEDLAAHWDKADLDHFVALLTECANNIGSGIAAETEKEAITCFRRAFGDEFPA